MNNAAMQAPLRTYYHQPPVPAAVAPPGYTMPLPEKMEMRVVEYTKGERLVKTILEYRMHYYDQHGSLVSTTDWDQVERVRIDIDGQ